ncbi:MAG: hypothetical protein WCT03_18240 [Candidatus Obscuribacterales bacterium]
MRCRKKKTKGLLHLLDRIMFFSAVVPPGYIIYRFVRWFIRQEDGLSQSKDTDEAYD